MFILLLLIAILSIIAGNFEKRATGRLTIAGVVFRTFMLGAWLYFFIIFLGLNAIEKLFRHRIDLVVEMTETKIIMLEIESVIEE
ncbi:hypothetical protein CPT_Slocum_046 [Serratia phage Slocum]|nr:hypothetical protein CPT_Slocum_046 [Serratia phage Slocum]URC22486.1 hypothetical protein KAMAJI_00580 [Serratia phage vB_SmaM-Kamaji]